MQCPYCKETILDGARVCKHCGKDQPAEKSRKRKLWLWALAVVGAIIAFAIITGPSGERNVAIANCRRAVEATGGASGVSPADCDHIVDETERVENGQ